MTPYTAAARAAWGMWRRDAALLWPLFGLTQLLPILMRLLALPPLPQLGADAADTVDRLRALGDYGRANLPLILAILVMQTLGRATLFSLYRAPPGRTLGTALGEAALLLPRYLLVALVVTLGTTLGLLLFWLPGLYLAGRLILVGPVLVARPDRPALSALVESWRLTRGHGLMLMALVALAELSRALIERPFAFGRALLPGPSEDSVLDALLALAQSGVVAAILLALALFQAALYRELAGERARGSE